MAHKHSVYDTDAHFTIDPITRAITSQAENKTKLMQHDHNAERFTFEIPRLVEGHDMSLSSKIEIHYINIDAATKEQNKDVYLVEDMQLSPESDDVVIFSWLISKNATLYAGTLSFIISFKCLTDSTIDYSWGTDIYKGISIGEGINNGEALVEEYSDILEAWKEDVLATLKEKSDVILEEWKNGALQESLSEWKNEVVEETKNMSKDKFVPRMPEIDKEVENDPNYKFAYDFAGQYDRVYVEQSGGGWNGNGGDVYNKYVITSDGNPVYDPDFKDYKLDENGKPCGAKLNSIPMRLGHHGFMRVPPYTRAQIAALGLSESERKQLTAPIVYVDEAREDAKAEIRSEYREFANAIYESQSGTLLAIDDISPLGKNILVHSAEGGTDIIVSGSNFAYEDTVTSKGSGSWKAYTMKVYPPKNRKYILSCDFENVTGLNIGIAVKQDDSSSYPNWWKEVDSSEASGSLTVEIEGGEYAKCVALKFYSNATSNEAESECIFKNIVFRLADMDVPAGSKGCEQAKYTTDAKTGNITVSLPDVDKVLIYSLDEGEITATYGKDTRDFVEDSISAIPRQVQNISSIDTIYYDISELPKLEASMNGTRYLAFTKGELPIVICDWWYADQEWRVVDRLRGSTLYFVLNRGLGYYYQSSEPYLYPMSKTKLSELENDTKFIPRGDIIDSLTSSAVDKPLSAAQGKWLKKLIDENKVITKLADMEEDAEHRTVTDVEREAWNNKSELAIPTHLSQFIEDEEHRTVTDVEKAAWDAKSDFDGKYSSLSGKPTIPSVPSRLSGFNDDATSRHVSDTEKAAWNAKSTFSGSYNDLTNKPSILSRDEIASISTSTLTSFVDSNLTAYPSKSMNQGGFTSGLYNMRLLVNSVNYPIGLRYIYLQYDNRISVIDWGVSVYGILIPKSGGAPSFTLNGEAWTAENGSIVLYANKISTAV